MFWLGSFPKRQLSIVLPKLLNWIFERDFKMTQNELKELLHYNSETGIFTWLQKVSNIKKGAIAGTLHHSGYYQIRINKKIYLSHRLAWFYIHGYFPNLIDHINGIGIDNKLCNLREATYSQNNCNKKLTKSTSGIKGVCWDKNKSKWVARIMFNKKTINLGRFDDLKKAKLMVENARVKYHGEFANHG